MAARLSMTEKQLHKLVVEYFETVLAPEVIWFHYRANDINRRVGGMWQGLGVKAGVWDFCIMFGTTREVIWIELKSENGELTEKQEEFRKRAQAMGHYCFVCRTLDTVRAALSGPRVPMRSHTMIRNAAKVAA